MNVLIFIVKADLNSEQQPISLVIPDDINNLDNTKIQTVNNRHSTSNKFGPM